jgi:hypothetical protein
MNNIKVEVNLSKEDRELLESIREHLAEYVRGYRDKASIIAEQAAKMRKAAVESAESIQLSDKLQRIQADVSAATQKHERDPETIITADDGLPFDIEGPDMPKISLGDIRKKVTQLRASNNPKKKDGAKDIIKAYAANISGLPADKYPEVWERLTALEQEG